MLITDSIVSSFLAGNRRLVSSVKKWTIDFEKTLCRTFTQSRKIKGPNVESCRQVTVLTLVECPGKFDYYFLFLRYDINQLLASPRIP